MGAFWSHGNLGIGLRFNLTFLELLYSFLGLIIEDYLDFLFFFCRFFEATF